jgi:hypothetical protein
MRYHLLIIMICLSAINPKCAYSDDIKGTIIIGNDSYEISGQYVVGINGFLDMEIKNNLFKKEIHLKLQKNELMVSGNKSTWRSAIGKLIIKEQLEKGIYHNLELNDTFKFKSDKGNVMYESIEPIEIFNGIEGKLQLTFDGKTKKIKKVVFYSLGEWLNPFGKTINMIMEFDEKNIK